MGLVLQDLGLKKFLLLERHEVGASFRRWPPGMRFITPSFTSNSFGALDLNSISRTTSPAYTLRTEHPTGEQYANYLQAVANHYELPVELNIEVTGLRRLSHGFLISTSQGDIHSRFVIWAAGEFQYPYLDPFPGAELCSHNSQITDWQELAGEKIIVIGGYESGMDAAFHLLKAGKQVTVLDLEPIWNIRASDPSITLSPFTMDRLRRARHQDKITLQGDLLVSGVERANGHFVVHARHVETRETLRFECDAPPVLATGFSGSVGRLARDFFAWHEDLNYPLLTEDDESTITPGLFLTGPTVRHEKVIFCFIYKFRQRFAVIANALAARLRLDPAPLELYRQRGMFLDDLTCCAEECEC